MDQKLDKLADYILSLLLTSSDSDTLDNKEKAAYCRAPLFTHASPAICSVKNPSTHRYAPAAAIVRAKAISSLANMSMRPKAAAS